MLTAGWCPRARVIASLASLQVRRCHWSPSLMGPAKSLHHGPSHAQSTWGTKSKSVCASEQSPGDHAPLRDPPNLGARAHALPLCPFLRNTKKQTQSERAKHAHTCARGLEPCLTGTSDQDDCVQNATGWGANNRASTSDMLLFDAPLELHRIAFDTQGPPGQYLDDKWCKPHDVMRRSWPLGPKAPKPLQESCLDKAPSATEVVVAFPQRSTWAQD